MLLRPFTRARRTNDPVSMEIGEWIASQRGTLSAAIYHADRERFGPIPVFLADLHGNAHIVEGQVQMVEPDIACFFVYRERIMSLAHAGLAVARREVVWPTADLHHVVRCTRYTCNKVSFICGEQPVKRRFGQSLMMAQHQCAQGLLSGHLEDPARWKRDARSFQLRDGIGPPYLAADGERAGTGPAGRRMRFAARDCRRRTEIRIPVHHVLP